MSLATFQALYRNRPIGRILALVGLVSLAAALIGGTIQITDDARKARDADTARLSAFASTWQSKINTRLSEAVSLAGAAAGFASGGITAAMNHSGNLSERLQVVNLPQWDVFMSTAFDLVPGITSVQLQPSGIIGQAYPPNPALFGFDVFNLFESDRAAFVDLIRRGTPFAAGPAELAGTGGYGIFARFPVFVSRNKSYETWWGAGTVVFAVQPLFEGLNMSSAFADAGMEFIVYLVSPGDAAAAPTIIYQSRANATVSDFNDGTRFQAATQDPSVAMYVGVRQRGGLASNMPRAALICAVAFGSMASAAALVALLLLGLLAWHEARHLYCPHVSPAPQRTFMALVGVKRLGLLTNAMDSESLRLLLAKFERRTARMADTHRCYSTGRISTGCCLVVASDIEDLLAFSKAVCAESTLLSRRDRAQLERSPSIERWSSNVDASAAADVPQQLTTGTGVQPALEFGVAVHVGQLSASYFADLDRVTFHGAAVTEAASAVDSTYPGELVATAQAAAAPEFDESRVIDQRETDSGAVIAVVMTGVVSGPRSPLGTPTTGRMTETTDSGVLSALSKSGEVVKKNVAVVAIRFSDDAGVALASNAALINEAVKRYGGDVVTMFGGALVVVFNAFTPVPMSIRRAAQFHAYFFDSVMPALGLRGGAAGAAHGMARVGVMADGKYVLCAGDAPARAHRLAAVARQCLIDNNDAQFANHLLIDAHAVGDLRTAYEVQCVGPLMGPKDASSLCYLLMQPWGDDAAGDDEWLYRLQRMESTSAYATLNAAFEGSVAQRDAAKRELLLGDAVQIPAPASASSNANFSRTAVRQLQVLSPPALREA